MLLFVYAQIKPILKAKLDGPNSKTGFCPPGYPFSLFDWTRSVAPKDSSIPATELAQHREIHLELKNDDFTDFEKCAK